MGQLSDWPDANEVFTNSLIEKLLEVNNVHGMVYFPTSDITAIIDAAAICRVHKAIAK